MIISKQNKRAKRSKEKSYVLGLYIISGSHVKGFFKQGMKCRRERKQHLRKSTVTWWVALWKPLMPTTCYRKRMTLCCKNVILINQKRIIKEKIKILAPTKHTRKFQIQLNICSTESKVRRFSCFILLSFCMIEVIMRYLRFSKEETVLMVFQLFGCHVFNACKSTFHFGV